MNYMSINDDNAPVFEPVEDGFDPEDLDDHEAGDNEGPEDGI